MRPLRLTVLLSPHYDQSSREPSVALLLALSHETVDLPSRMQLFYLTTFLIGLLLGVYAMIRGVEQWIQ